MTAASKRLRKTFFGTALLAIAIAIAVFAMPMTNRANAGSAIDWHCGCDVGGTRLSDTCTCTGFTYDIAKLGTKKFHGWCDKSLPGGGKPYADFINVMRGKNVTCASASHGHGQMEVLKQCTNWGTGKRNSVTMTIQCRGRV